MIRRILTKSFYFSLYVNGTVCVNNLRHYNIHCVLFDLSSFTNLVICNCVLKIQIIKLAYTLKIDCFLTGNNHLCYIWRKVEKLMHLLGYGFYWISMNSYKTAGSYCLDNRQTCKKSHRTLYIICSKCLLPGRPQARLRWRQDANRTLNEHFLYFRLFTRSWCVVSVPRHLTWSEIVVRAGGGLFEHVV